MDAPRSGCPHHPHTFYCAQMNSLWCSTCVEHVARNVADSEILGALSFDSISTIAELAKEQTGRLASVQSVLRRVLHRQADSLLDCAEIAKKELSDYFADVTAMIRKVHERLVQDVDLLIAARRGALLKVSEAEEAVTMLVADTLIPRQPSAVDVVQCTKRIVREADALLVACEERLAQLLPSQLRPVLGASLQTQSNLEGNTDSADGAAVSVELQGLVSRNPQLLKHLEAPYSIAFKKEWCFFDLNTLSVRDSAGNSVRSVPQASNAAASTASQGSARTRSTSGSNNNPPPLLAPDGDGSRVVMLAAPQNLSMASKRLWKPYLGIGEKKQRAIVTPDASVLI
jgi:hypothetical protein